MLYGNIIFIKKAGGDGSKFPVTEKSIKIGRSEECVIRIYNTQVALDHCQLIIGDNGQAILRDLCKQTILNGKILDQGEVTLCHGDVFKVGERLARWEYLPTSRYCRQLRSPTGRLVAVVMPQQRSSDEQSTPGTSAAVTSILKSTPLGGKRRFSERFASETSSASKMRKSSSSDLIKKSKVDLSKFLTGRHSLKSTKLLLPGAKIKDRKSISGVTISKSKAKTPKKTSRKSTLPSWKVNIVTPPSKSPRRSLSLTKSQNKSKKSPKSTNKIVTDSVNLKSEEPISTPKTLRTPQKLNMASEEIVKSVSKSVSKTPLKPIKESPLKGRGSKRLTQNFSKSPSKSPLASTASKVVRLVQSERKPRPSLKNYSKLSKELKRLSVVLSKEDFLEKNINKKQSESFLLKESRPRSQKISSDVIVQPTLKNDEIKELQVTGKRSSVKISAVKTPGNLEKSPRKGSENKAISSPKNKLETPKMGKNSAHEKLATPAPSKNVPLNKTLQELEMTVGKTRPSSSRKVLNKTISPLSSPKSAKNSFVQSAATPKSQKTPSVRSSRKTTSPRKTTPSRGVRRKLSPSVSSAERAAKKLKISTPRKPDKNKKAALLVLGKANRKQLLSQNVKVLLKQKIIKKAIKQSTASSQVNNNVKLAPVTTVRGKTKKKISKLTSKSKRKEKKNQTPSKRNSSLEPSKPTEVSSRSKDKVEFTPKDERAFEEKLRSSLASKEGSKSAANADEKYSNQQKKIESPKPPLKSAMKERSSLFANFDKSAENYFFNSMRRSSKRLSSKNDTGRPDFVELSPTALGLIPKNLDIFKTPKQNKRRVSNLVTPKNDKCVGIIRSASTSKVGGHRKSVRFSSKDGSINPEFFTPNANNKTDFDFNTLQTPDMSVDVFVSPLSDKSGASQRGLNDISRITLASEHNSALAKIYKSNSEPRKFVRKLLQSPPPSKRSPTKRELSRSPRSTSKSPVSAKFQKEDNVHEDQTIKGESSGNEQDLIIFTTPKTQKSPKSSASEQPKQVLKVLQNQRNRRSPKNDLTDLRGVKKLLTTPKPQKSPKNDLSDVRGVKQLLKTPRTRRSPKNDLSDVRGVKKLLASPKVQKSPKNDLSDIKGVKKLLATPKVQKSPKNDLSNVQGVKKLLTTPKVQRSPKNELTDLRGVKQLLGSPRTRRSPKNDLSDVRGVKKLLATPKVQRSPKNDLSDVRGVKKLVATPKVQKSPKNELTDLRGVKQLLGSPRTRRSPKNDLSDVRGVKKLVATPKVQKGPKNDLNDLTGVKELFGSPNEEYVDFSEIKNFLGSPKLKRNSKNAIAMGETESFLEFLKESLSERTSPRSQRSSRSSLVQGARGKVVESPKIVNSRKMLTVEVKKLLKSPNASLQVIEKSVRKTPTNKRIATPKSQANNVKGVKKSSTPKSPKNDLSDLTGVRELFSRHEPVSDVNESVTGAAQLSKSPKARVISPVKMRKSPARSRSRVAQKELKKAPKEENQKKTTRGRNLRKAAAEETPKKEVRSVRSRNAALKADDDIPKESTSRRPTKRKAAETSKVTRSIKSSPVAKRSQRATKETKKSEKTLPARTKAGASESTEVTNPRKRKLAEADVVPSPPKLRRKQTANAKSSSSTTAATIRKTTTRSKPATVSTTKTVKSVRKTSRSGKTKTTKSTTKVQNKRSQSTSDANPSDSQIKLSPVKTRSAKAKSTARQGRSETKKSEGTTGRKKSTPVTKRSTRRK